MPHVQLSSAARINLRIDALRKAKRGSKGRIKKKFKAKIFKQRQKLRRLERSFSPLVKQRSQEHITRRGLTPSAVLSGQPKRTASAVTGTTLLRVN